MGSSPKCSRQLGKTYTNDSDRGLNQEIVPMAQEAFDAYGEAIEDAISEFKASVTNYNAALFGTTSEACKKHIDSAIDACYDILGELKSFQNDLTTAAENYVAHDTSVASSL